MSTLSVLITYHNEGRWLRDCIASVQNQPGAPDEILVYDDASSIPAADHVPANVTVIRGEHNAGPARARNILMQKATCEFIHFHDADDAFLPGWCTAIREALPNADVIVTDAKSDEKEHILQLYDVKDDLLRFAIRGAIMPCGITYKRDLALKAGGYDESLHQSEDWEFHLRLLSPSPPHLHIPKDLVWIRTHANQRSNKRIEVWSSALDAIEKLSLPKQYADDIAWKAMTAGRILYDEGEVELARRAFDVAMKRSSNRRVPFDNRNMRMLARVFGPLQALRIRSAMTRGRDTRRVLRDGIPARDGREAARMLSRFTGRGGLKRVHAVQAQNEIVALLDFLREQKVRRLCELGTYLGGTFFMFSRVLPDDAVLISIDLPDAFPEMKPVFERFARAHQQVFVLHLDSHQPSSVERVRETLKGELLDFLFIDADHSVSGVRSDFELFGPLVREGGWIGFHDIVPNHAEADWGIPELWAQLKQRYEAIEFVEPSSRDRQQGLGIGVLRWTGSGG